MKDRAVLKWIYTRCGKRGGEIAVLAALNVWASVCVTLFALLSKTVVDCAENGDGKGLVKSALFLLLLIGSQLLARVIMSLLEAASQGRAEIALKTHIFSEILYGDYAESTRRHSGDIMTRLTADVTTAADSSVSILPTLTGYGARLISAAAALLVLDRRFAAVFIAGAALVTVIAALFRKPLKNMHRRVQEKDGRLRSFLQEMTENLFAVKVFGIEKKVVESAGALQKGLYREKIRRKRFSVFAAIGFSAAFAAGFLAAVSYGSYGLFKGTATFGTVLALIQLVNQLQSPVMGITGALPAFFSMLASAQRLIELEGEPEKNDGGICDLDGFKAIGARGVSFGYGDGDVLKSVDFTVEKGDFVGVRGRSGAGKTTVFKLITGLYKPRCGEVYIEINNRRFAPEAVSRRMFSVVPQGNMLFSGTVRENLTLLSPNADKEKISRALSLACADFVYGLPRGLDTALGEDGAGISEGQAQRIAVARALLGEGKILLMDEATSALDAETEKRLLDNLRAVRDLTVIFITHREAVLDFCDKIITVTDGKISEAVNK